MKKFQEMIRKYIGIVVGIVALTVFVLFNSAFIVDETEQVVLTQFGKVVRTPVTAPGLNFRIPFIQKTTYFPKNLQEWDGDPGQVPTKDKTYIWVDTFARWKIVDPVKYFQTVSNMVSALGRLDDIIDPAMRNLLTSFRLVESVRNSDRPMDTFESLDEEDGKKHSQYKIDVGRSEITRRIMAQAQPKVEKFGIELVDIKIKRINYVAKVRNAVYGRMIAERKQIAEKFRAEGKGEASNIRGDKEKELQLITSEAYKTAEEIKGKADATATAIYAASYGVDPGFYSFSKTLEVYKDTLDKESTLVLSTDSDFMRYFKGIN
ncbi:MAG: protease modulator HflC [Thermodesulfobacteriota bacterium]|nr:protease modulator HflC [Thermodesulfobacteriota bacterium]